MQGKRFSGGRKKDNIDLLVKLYHEAPPFIALIGNSVFECFARGASENGKHQEEQCQAHQSESALVHSIFPPARQALLYFVNLDTESFDCHHTCKHIDQEIQNSILRFHPHFFYGSGDDGIGGVIADGNQSPEGVPASLLSNFRALFCAGS